MEPSPLPSRAASSASRRTKLMLDLSKLPAVTSPAPATNTLLFTNINSVEAFRPDNLQAIRDLIEKTAPIHAFAPLKSFCRIVVSFDVDAATEVKEIWDGESIIGHPLCIYGQNTPLEAKDEHLALPDAGKLFFISPPPSPPHGWEMRFEDAPNKTVHASDLAGALAKLSYNHTSSDLPLSPCESKLPNGPMRSRSSTLVYCPSDHGHGSNVPSVVVEDLTDKPGDFFTPDSARPIMAHTMRPPPNAADC